MARRVGLAQLLDGYHRLHCWVTPQGLAGDCKARLFSVLTDMTWFEACRAASTQPDLAPGMRRHNVLFRPSGADMVQSARQEQGIALRIQHEPAHGELRRITAS
ncbi:hypothetical protein STUTZSP0542_20540 [Stutzerimonas marianensis]